MPLGSWFSFHWYPGQISLVDKTVMDSDLTMRSLNNMSALDTVIPTADVKAIVTKTMSLSDITVPTSSLTMRSLNTMTLLDKIGVLTADDVTGAVLTAEVAPGLTFKQALLDARKAAKLAAALSA